MFQDGSELVRKGKQGFFFGFFLQQNKPQFTVKRGCGNSQHGSNP